MTFSETGRLILRSWKSGDLPLFAKMNKEERVMRYFPSTLTDEQTESFYNRTQSEFEHPSLPVDSPLGTHVLYRIEL